MKFQLIKNGPILNPEWVVDVKLEKSEREQVLSLLSIDTIEALKIFKNEEELEIAKDTYGDFKATLVMYPYPDLDEFYTRRDNCAVFVAVESKVYEFEKTCWLSKKVRKALKHDIMAPFKIKNYYAITKHGASSRYYLDDAESGTLYIH